MVSFLSQSLAQCGHTFAGYNRVMERCKFSGKRPKDLVERYVEQIGKGPFCLVNETKGTILFIVYDKQHREDREEKLS